MAVGPEAVRRGGDPTRRLIPLVAAVIVLLAWLTDPGDWWELVALVVGASVIGAWAQWDLPLPLVAAAAIVGTALSQWSGHLEPGMFLLSLLGLVLTGWAPLRWQTGLLLLVLLATPMVVMALQDEGGIAGPIWVVGVAFPAFMGWAFYRQETLTATLDAARRELAEQAVHEERRRIARDVHDLVGHGLAAMMLQVTSARHVLRRDPDEADEALRAAEDIGRRSMQDLRSTVASLREGDSAVAGPPPTLLDVRALVEATRLGGLDVEHRASGDQGEVDPAIGLTLYRIAQEALANAARHAPDARTVVETRVAATEITLDVHSRGPIREPVTQDATRARYGLRGMRERADVVSAEFSAGPVADGWLVHCRVPLHGPATGLSAPAVSDQESPEGSARLPGRAASS
jgi:signal transduction histidine kinase